jgi:hypothetical protein
MEARRLSDLQTVDVVLHEGTVTVAAPVAGRRPAPEADGGHLPRRFAVRHPDGPVNGPRHSARPANTHRLTDPQRLTDAHWLTDTQQLTDSCCLSDPY